MRNYKLRKPVDACVRKFGWILPAAGLLLPLQVAQADVVIGNDWNEERMMKYTIRAAYYLSVASMGASKAEIDHLAALMNQQRAIIRRANQAKGITPVEPADGVAERAAFSNWINAQFNKGTTSFLAASDQMRRNDGVDVFGRPINGNPNLNDLINKWPPFPKEIAPSKFNFPADSNGEHTITESVFRYKDHSWWNRTLTGDDGLRQRMAWGLSQIFVVPGELQQSVGSALWRQPIVYYDLLMKNAFGNYRNLLEDVTYNPFMGFSLSHLKNDKGNPSLGVYPDENFAREILQLFSIGIYKLNIDGTPVLNRDGSTVELYDNDTIRAFARVFTGFGYRNPTGDWTKASSRSASGVLQTGRMTHVQPYVDVRMDMYDWYHDFGAKDLLVYPGSGSLPTVPARKAPFRIGDAKIGAGAMGNEDVRLALDNIAGHPNVAPFMSKLLIQRFSASNPSPKYVRDVATVWNDSKGDLKQVLRAILLHDEVIYGLKFSSIVTGNKKFRRLFVSHSDGTGVDGKLKEPVLMLTQILKFCEPESPNVDGSIKSRHFFQDPEGGGEGTRQQVMHAPSVFNYYSAEFAPASGPLHQRSLQKGEVYLTPEMELLPISSIPFSNFLVNTAKQGVLWQRGGKHPDANRSPSVPLTKLQSDQSTWQNNEWSQIKDLNVYLMYGTMSSSLQNKIRTELGSAGLTNQEEFGQALSLIFSSANFAVNP